MALGGLKNQVVVRLGGGMGGRVSGGRREWRGAGARGCLASVRNRVRHAAGMASAIDGCTHVNKLR